MASCNQEERPVLFKTCRGSFIPDVTAPSQKVLACLRVLFRSELPLANPVCSVELLFSAFPCINTIGGPFNVYHSSLPFLQNIRREGSHEWDGSHIFT